MAALPKSAQDIGAADIQAPLGRMNPIAKLVALHDEARETATLANLLGRAPYAAGLLALCVIAVAAISLSTTPMPDVATWSVLMLIGIGAIVRSYSQAISAPFERANLRGFASDLVAIAAYCGFAWGAGAYLALPTTTPPLLMIVFAAMPCILIGAALRHRESVIAFTAPIATLAAFSSVLRPFPDGALAAAFVLISCAAVGGAIFWVLGKTEPAETAPTLTELAVS